MKVFVNYEYVILFINIVGIETCIHPLNIIMSVIYIL